MIYPYLIYCNEVWGNAAQAYLSTLQTLQKKAIRIITSSNLRAESEPIFRKLNILKISKIHFHTLAILMFKFIKGMLPNIFKDLFKRNSDISTRMTRNSSKLNLPHCKTEMYKSSVKFQGPKLWNSLEDNVDHYCSVHSFKKRVKKYVIDMNM
jgi:hypothetical protein